MAQNKFGGKYLLIFYMNDNVEEAWGNNVKQLLSLIGLMRVRVMRVVQKSESILWVSLQNGGCNVPNLKQDLRRLGLDHHTTSAAADMSLSALYLHELHHR